MILKIVFLFILHSYLVSAYPVYPNNQVPRLPFQPGGFDLPANVGFFLQEPTNNYQNYPQEFNNQICPCHNQGNNLDGFNQVDYNSILNNPVVTNLLNPNFNQRKNEVTVSGQLQNCPLSSKIPSIVNNYIVIPPEAFIGTENNIAQNKRSETKQKTGSNGKDQFKITKNNKQKKSEKKNKKRIKIRRKQKDVDKDVEVFGGTNSLKNKESLKIEPTKPSRSNSNQQIEPNWNCKTGIEANAAPSNTCGVLNNNCCTDFNLMNFPQMFPFFPGFSPNVNFAASHSPCCGNQMMCPGFSSFFSNPYLFNYQQMLNNAVNNNINKNQSSNKVKAQKTTSKTSKNSTPTVILNIKKVNSDASRTSKSKTIEKNDSTHESLKKADILDVIEDKIISDIKTPERSAKMIQLKEEENQKITEPPKSSIAPVTTTTPVTTIGNDTVENTSTLKPNSLNDEEKIPFTEISSARDEKMLSKPELGSEDEVPTLHENHVIEDYYPDFRNDNKYQEIDESEDMNHLIMNSDNIGQSDLSRERRKLQRPLHEYNFFRQQQLPSRNYYKLDRDPALNEIPTTEDPNQTKSANEIENHTTVKSTETNDEDITYFITPPSLDKIDFKTKQINKENNGGNLDIEEIENIKDKKMFNDNKSSTFSNSKVLFNSNLKPKNDVKFKKTSPIVHDIETIYGHSKVMRYGKAPEFEDSIEKSIEDDNPTELSAEKPFIVLAQPISNEA